MRCKSKSVTCTHTGQDSWCWRRARDSSSAGRKCVQMMASGWKAAICVISARVLTRSTARRKRCIELSRGASWVAWYR
ncbi:hypothetical protein D3C72_1527410 [compost metagenome]